MFLPFIFPIWTFLRAKDDDYFPNRLCQQVSVKTIWSKSLIFKWQRWSDELWFCQQKLRKIMYIVKWFKEPWEISWVKSKCANVKWRPVIADPSVVIYLFKGDKTSTYWFWKPLSNRTMKNYKCILKVYCSRKKLYVDQALTSLGSEAFRLWTVTHWKHVVWWNKSVF